MLRQLKLLIDNIEAGPVRENFLNLKKFFNQEKQLKGFTLIEETFTETGSNILRPHNLGITPKDAVITSVAGDGTIVLNYGKFDGTNLDITVGGTVSSDNPTVLRMYVGTNVEGDIVT